MALNTELLITLQQLKGIGNKTILKVADNITADNINELSNIWSTFKEKRLLKITKDDLHTANRCAKRIIEASLSEGIGIISYYESVFPNVLKRCIGEDGKLNPPIVLYYRGNLKALELPGIAVIGTREPTPMGIKAGLYFAEEFAKNGFNIVSGLATGCDTAGHEGALAAGGITTAFLANGLAWENIYPEENQNLARRIVDKGGLLLSEYPLGQHCGKYSLVERDRLQANLSYATLVVQTGLTGGTMHAVRTTIEANKPLFAVKFNRIEEQILPQTQVNAIMINKGDAKPCSTKEMPQIIETLKELVSTTCYNSDPQTLFSAR